LIKNNNPEESNNTDDKFIAVFPFIKEDVKLVASVDKQSGKQQLIIQKIDRATGKIELQDSLDCIHTALFNIDADEYDKSQNDGAERQNIYSLSLEKRNTNDFLIDATQFNRKIDLEPSERFLAFKSWVQGIAEAGLGAFELQTNIELEGSLLYPISKFLLRFFTKIDQEFIPSYIQKVQKDCVFENQQHDPCYISNLMPILSVIVDLFGDIQIPFKDKLSMQILEYIQEIQEIHPPKKLFESDPRFGIFLLQSGDMNALLRICIELKKILPRQENLHNFKIESGISNSFVESNGRVIGLDLSENHLEKYIPDISKLTELEELDLSFNELESIPNSVGNLKNLKILTLSRNNLLTLPTTLGNLHKLERLHLIFNKIKDLPINLSRLKSLIVLNIERNELDHIPDCIYDLFNLLRLNLNENIITHIDGKISNLYQIQGLYVTNNKLTHLPDVLGNLKYLVELNLSGNAISALPDSIKGLGSLQDLNLNGNILGKDGSEGKNSLETIKNIKNLIVLRINHNFISEIPVSIMQLEHLQILDLEGNTIVQLPHTIGALQELKILNLDSNLVSSIPDSFRDHHSIKKMYFRYNKIKELSPSLIKLTTLSEFILNNNQIERLDEDLLNIDFLNTLDLSENPICNSEQYFLIQISLVLGRIIQKMKVLQKDKNGYIKEGDHITGVNLVEFNMKKIPKSVLNLKFLSQFLVNGDLIDFSTSFGQ
jgi:Leucine-rich repeat (LRR) protein